MKKLAVVFVLLLLGVAIFAQDQKLEIYLVAEGRVISGVLTGDRNDSLFFDIDEAGQIAFAKSELEGMDLGVSKETKKLQKTLIRAESTGMFKEFPGMRQYRKGEKVKGGTIAGFTYAGLGLMVITIGEWIWRMVHISSLGEAIFSLFPNPYLLVSGILISMGALVWNHTDLTVKLVKEVKNRYYFVGENLPAYTVSATPEP